MSPPLKSWLSQLNFLVVSRCPFEKHKVPHNKKKTKPLWYRADGTWVPKFQNSGSENPVPTTELLGLFFFFFVSYVFHAVKNAAVFTVSRSWND